MGTSHPQALPQPLWGEGEWKQTDSGSQGTGTAHRPDPCVLQSQAQHQILWHENFAVHCTFHVKAEEILEKVLKVTMFELTETTSPIGESFI